MREIQQPTFTDRGAEEHPAFGVATVHRSEGGSRSLFQSDVKHSSTIRIAIHRADRKRDLNHDWVPSGHSLAKKSHWPAARTASPHSSGERYEG